MHAVAPELPIGQSVSEEFVRIRKRRDQDVDRLVRLIGSVRDVDGYPSHVTGAGLQTFVVAGDELAALVAEDEAGVAVGHAAVHEPAVSPVTDAAAAATGRGLSGLACIARLFVDPAVRRAGVGGLLLDAATDAAWGMDRWPFLDVWEALPNALALYDSRGWLRVGTEDIVFTSPCVEACRHVGNSIRSHVLVAPPPSAPSRPA